MEDSDIRNRTELSHSGKRQLFRPFDDDYVFYGESESVVGRQIGNAVPVKLAEAIGQTLMAMEANYQNNLHNV